MSLSQDFQQLHALGRSLNERIQAAVKDSGWSLIYLPHYDAPVFTLSRQNGRMRQSLDLRIEENGYAFINMKNMIDDEERAAKALLLASLELNNEPEECV